MYTALPAVTYSVLLLTATPEYEASLNPPHSAPAMVKGVETALVDNTSLRMHNTPSLARQSAIHRLPAVSVAIPDGLLNTAAAPTPSTGVSTSVVSPASWVSDRLAYAQMYPALASVK